MTVHQNIFMIFTGSLALLYNTISYCIPDFCFVIG